MRKKLAIALVVLAIGVIAMITWEYFSTRLQKNQLQDQLNAQLAKCRQSLTYDCIIDSARLAVVNNVHNNVYDYSYQTLMDYQVAAGDYPGAADTEWDYVKRFQHGKYRDSMIEMDGSPVFDDQSQTGIYVTWALKKPEEREDAVKKAVSLNNLRAVDQLRLIQLLDLCLKDQQVSAFGIIPMIHYYQNRIRAVEILSGHLFAKNDFSSLWRLAESTPYLQVRHKIIWNIAFKHALSAGYLQASAAMEKIAQGAPRDAAVASLVLALANSPDFPASNYQYLFAELDRATDPRLRLLVYPTLAEQMVAKAMLTMVIPDTITNIKRDFSSRFSAILPSVSLEEIDSDMLLSAAQYTASLGNHDAARQLLAEVRLELMEIGNDQPPFKMKLPTTTVFDLPKNEDIGFQLRLVNAAAKTYWTIGAHEEARTLLTFALAHLEKRIQDISLHTSRYDVAEIKELLSLYIDSTNDLAKSLFLAGGDNETIAKALSNRAGIVKLIETETSWAKTDTYWEVTKRNFLADIEILVAGNRLWRDQLPRLDPEPYVVTRLNLKPYVVSVRYELLPLVTMDSFNRFLGSAEILIPDLFSIAEINKLARDGKFQEALSLVDAEKLGVHTVDALGIIAMHVKKSKKTDKQAYKLMQDIKQEQFIESTNK